MKKDSGVKEQYSRISIFKRIYQHCTTREQIAFTLNHHHMTTSDNSRLPGNMPRPCIRVLPEQNNPDKCSGAAIGEVLSSFQTTQDSRPSNFLFQIVRDSGATLSECTFSFKKRTSPRRLLQDNSFSNNIGIKTLQLFVPNSKRLGGYTQ